MRGHVSALFAQFGRYRHAGNLYRAFVGLPGYYARRLAHRARGATLGPELAGLVAGLLMGWKYLPPRAFDVRPHGVPTGHQPAEP
jgi:hypothetical protein